MGVVCEIYVVCLWRWDDMSWLPVRLRNEAHHTTGWRGVARSKTWKLYRALGLTSDVV